jgi:hypothetical protein
VFRGGAITKTSSGGFGTTLILAILLVLVSAASDAGFVYLNWNPTEPQEPTVVPGIHRLNDLATVKYTTGDD